MGSELDRGTPRSAGGSSLVTLAGARAGREGQGSPAQHEHDLHIGGQTRVDLRFEPSGRQVRVPPGVTLFDAASWNGIAIDSTCGGHGTCKKCRVRATEGRVPPNSLDTRAFSADELRAGWRLACRVEVHSDLQVDVPPLLTRPKAATVGVGRKVILRPAVQKRYLELPHPSLSDQTTDSERLLGAMLDLELRIDLHALKAISRVLRSSDFKVTAVLVDDVLIDVEPGDTTDRLFGIAIDLGTTTCVATLLDLSTGTPLAVQSMLNKQQPFGGDVITRISTIMMDPAALERLGSLAHETLAELHRDGLRGRRRDAERGLRDRDRRQRDHDPHRARHRPGAARHGTVHHVGAALPRASRVRHRRRGASPCSGHGLSRLGGLRGR